MQNWMRTGAPLGAIAALALSGVAGAGPDVIVGDLPAVHHWTSGGPFNGMQSYSIGTTSCNIGDANLAWVSDSVLHPVIGQQMYRLHDGRIEQIGQAWLKHGFCALQEELCQECDPVGFFCEDALGVGCSDPYGSFLNGLQDGLGPKFEVNPSTGAFLWDLNSGLPTDFFNTGNILYKRVQVPESDLTVPGALYFVEGQYVHPEDSAAGNASNNASYRRVRVNGTMSLSVQDQTERMKPAIHAWRDYGGGVGVPDPAVTLVNIDVSSDGRFIAGYKVTDNGDGTWRYEYAVHNLNSHRAGASFSVPLPAGVTTGNEYFHDVDYHSGEPYDNTDWRATVGGGAITWNSPQTFAQNPNSNALRWSTMYNFAFHADAAPTMGTITLGLFRPGTPTSMTFDALVPGGAPCIAELTGDDPPSIDVFDLLAYLGLWFDGDPAAELDGAAGITVFDLLVYLGAWFEGC